LVLTLLPNQVLVRLLDVVGTVGLERVEQTIFIFMVNSSSSSSSGGLQEHGLP
jgi:hypothetical protein